MQKGPDPAGSGPPDTQRKLTSDLTSQECTT